jgi:hypothetical protein
MGERDVDERRAVPRELRGLVEIQRFVSDAVRGLDDIPRDPALAGHAESLIVPSARGMTPPERLEVYREQFWLRHLANLDEDFPTLTWVVGGREAFRALTTGYLRACPPRTWDLQRLGADLPGYIARDPRWGSDPLARDAARLDWAFMEAFDAPDSPPFDARILASTPEDAWPSARIDLHASLRLLPLGHPVHDLRLALQRGAEVERPVVEATHVVVYRDPACFLRTMKIAPLAFELLETLRSGTPLGEACEAAAGASQSDPSEIGERLGGWFQQWTAEGWIRAVRFEA